MDGYRYAGVVEFLMVGIIQIRWVTLDKKGRIISMIEDKKKNRENNQNT